MTTSKQLVFEKFPLQNKVTTRPALRIFRLVQRSLKIIAQLSVTHPVDILLQEISYQAFILIR